jgi:hypothetical protein
MQGNNRGYISLAAIILLLLLLLRQYACSPTDTKTIEYIKGVPDTVYLRDTIKFYVDNPKPIYIYENINNSGGADYHPCDSIRVYRSYFGDSLEGGALVRDSVCGILLAQEVTLYPVTKTITRVDTLREIITDNRPRIDLLGGVSLSATSLSPFLGVGASDSKRSAFVYYKPISQEIGVGVGIRLY